MPSDSAAMLQNDSMLFTSLATVPLPRPPMWITLALNDCRTGRASSNTFLSPPTMMAIVAASAPVVPPLTGASSMAMPLAAKASPIFFTIDGALVERSMKVWPLLILARMPPSPIATFSTSRGIGSEVMTISAPFVASATDLAPVPPRSVQVSSAAKLRSTTVTWWLERLMMLRHIGPPMLPTPMKPTFMASSPEKLRRAHYIRGMDPASPLLGRDADRAPARNEDRARALTRIKLAATLLLLSTAALFIAARHFEPMHWAWGYVAAFASAATVGGLADWYAVVALFRRPLGLPIPHTAIIPRNHERIADNLGTFIETNFLATEAVERKLGEVDFAQHMAAWLADRERSAALAAFV